MGRLYIYLLIHHKNQPSMYVGKYTIHVGKYTSPMDPMDDVCVSLFVA